MHEKKCLSLQQKRKKDMINYLNKKEGECYQENLIVCTPAQLRAIIREAIHEVSFSNSASNCQEEEQLLTPKEVCGILGVCPKTLQTLRDQRRIPFSQQGRKIWFKKSDIDSYLDGCRIISRR